MGSTHSDLSLATFPVALSLKSVKMFKFMLCLALAVAIVTAAPRPDDDDDHSHVSEIDGDTVRGTYRWTDDDGNDFYVSYVADEDGYRIVESNAVPVTRDGVAANGHQGAFESYEEEDFDSDED